METHHIGSERCAGSHDSVSDRFYSVFFFFLKKLDFCGYVCASALNEMNWVAEDEGIPVS